MKAELVKIDPSDLVLRIEISGKKEELMFIVEALQLHQDERIQQLGAYLNKRINGR